jgi:hypothetical protein
MELKEHKSVMNCHNHECVIDTSCEMKLRPAHQCGVQRFSELPLPLFKIFAFQAGGMAQW